MYKRTSDNPNNDGHTVAFEKRYHESDYVLRDYQIDQNGGQVEAGFYQSRIWAVFGRVRHITDVTVRKHEGFAAGMAPLTQYN